MIRRIVVAVVSGLLFTGLSLPSAVSAGNAPGSKCVKLGITAKSGSTVVKCEKIKSRLVWQKINQITSKLSSPKTPSVITPHLPAPLSLAGHGLLVMDCIGSSAIFRLVNAANGNVLVQKSLTPLMTMGTLGASVISVCSYARGSGFGGASNLYIREQFSRDFSEVAFTSWPQADGSTHIGYVSLDSNRYVDVTSRTASSGFSSTVPLDRSPVFDPLSGKLYYLRGSANSDFYEVHTYDSATNTDAIVGGINAPSYIGEASVNWITVQHSMFVQGEALLSPDGKFAAAGGSGAVGYSSLMPSNPPGTFQVISSGESFLGGGEGNYIGVYGWLGADSVAVFIYQGDTGIYRMPLNANAQIEAVPVNLLPESSATNTYAVISPDGSRVAFLHTSSSVIDLYTAPTAPGITAPEKIAGNFSGLLIGWQ